jgi:hypothetical protein
MRSTRAPAMPCRANSRKAARRIAALVRGLVVFALALVAVAVVMDSLRHAQAVPT